MVVTVDDKLTYAWLQVSSSPETQAELDALRRALSEHERRSALLAKVSDALAESRDLDAALRTIAKLVVNELADACALFARDDRKSLELCAFAAKDAAVEAALEASRPMRLGADADNPIAAAARSTKSVVVTPATEETFGAEARAVPWLGTLGPSSMIVTPLVAGGFSLGCFAFLRSGSAPYTDQDVPFTAEIARRCALAIDNHRAYRALEATSRAKDEFFASISDQLRSPLSSILRWVAVLKQEDAASSPTVRHGLESIEASARAQTRLVEDVLDVSRMIRGEVKIQPQALDLEPVLRDVVESMRAAADAKGLAISWVGCVGPCRIFGDVEHVRQIMWHLISNAVKFTTRGGSVRIDAAYEEGGVVVRVADTGRGIDPLLLPYVFDRFRQGTPSASGGRGLGLSIARHLVEMHGGTVTAASEGPGQGALFTVKIPTHPFAATLEPTSDKKRSGALSGVKVLVVEDVADARDLIEFVLTTEGAVVTGAGSAEEALDALGDFEPDVLVSDIGMPIHDGYWLVKEVHEKLPDLPAVALTAFSRREDAEAAHRAGFDVHLAKPVDPARLVEAVRLLLAL